MFGFRKNKKNNTQFTGTYIVQDTDNIISIAQMFGVPWKELAEYNKIDAPYILISGETISVPGLQTAVVESVQEDVQEQNILEQNHVEQENVGIKDNEPAMQKVPTIAEQRGEMTYVAQRDVQRANQGMLQHAEKRESLTMLEQGQRPIKRKVTFAAPQSMLAQPASEPTTRAIDIEWMRDDEEAYNEEMEFQRKSVNKRLIIVVIIGVCAIGGFIVWSILQWMQHDAEKKVSVETLIEENAPVKNDEDATASSSGDVAQENVSSEHNDDVVNTDEDQNTDEEKTNEQETQVTTVQKTPSEITVQVLNAGAATGAAGAVSAEIKNNGYKINSAQNAQGSYEDVMIYYASEMKDHVDALAQIIDAKYGNQKKEESADVTEKYKADVVIVLGT